MWKLLLPGEPGVVVSSPVERLPFEDGACGSAAVRDAGFVTVELATELRRVCRPGALVVVECGRGRTASAARRLLARSGFDHAGDWAPVPDTRKTRALLPVGEPVVARYFLRGMVRRNALANRIALAAAGLLIRLGLLAHAVPSLYVVFRKV